MNKSDLIKRISENSGFSSEKVRSVINAFIKILINKVIQGESIKFQRFGKWHIKSRAPRRSYNIVTQSVESLPAKRTIVFSPSKELCKQTSQNEQYSSEVVSVKINPTSILKPLANHDNKAITSKKEINNGKTPKDLKTITISRTGIKIDTGSPNFGHRIKQPQTIESGGLKYCGKTSYYETEPAEIEEFSYPSLLCPFVETPILDYNTNRFATGGVMEPVLTEALKELSEIEPQINILQNTSLPVHNRIYGYKPDIAIVWREKNIFIDVEIDEPYDIISRKPIHYKGCSDKLRNSYFLDNGWFIIRVAEKQIVDNCKGVVDFIKFCFFQLAEDIRFKSKNNVNSIERWSYSEAKKWAEEDYRETYLGIENISRNEITIEEFENPEFSGISSQEDNQSSFIKPKEDIISDRYADMRKQITKICQNGQYIIFSLRHKCYDYVALSNRITFTRRDDAYGVKLFDEIEKKDIFLRFQEIASFRCQNSIIKYEAEKNENWDALLYDAILNSNPIEIEYDTAGQGISLRRTVLYVTLWYNFLNDNDNREKYSVIELLKIAALFKYQTLAKSKQIGYISGFCNYRQDLRTFNINRIKGGCIFDCRKNLYKISSKDIWKILEKGYADMAINMYNEFNEQEQKELFHKGNYANALVMQGKLDEAMCIYKSVSPDTIMPQSTFSWKDACLDDFDFFISEDIKKNEFEKIKSKMREMGW